METVLLQLYSFGYSLFSYLDDFTSFLSWSFDFNGTAYNIWSFILPSVFVLYIGVAIASFITDVVT